MTVLIDRLPLRALRSKPFGILLVLLGSLGFLALMLRIAWTCDDAYIIFRTLEQIMAGRGPRWNPHERVQAFTSPLWLFVLLIPRLFSANVFLNAIGVSLVLGGLLLVLLYRWARHPWGYLALLVILASSKGFFDYTTSGLESPLAYVLLTLFALQVRAWSKAPPQEQPSLARRVVLTGGLVILTRYDLGFLVLPAMLWIAWHTRPGLSLSALRYHLRTWTPLLTPLLGWMLFALFYYGTVLPNTAYAKLPPGYPRWALLRQGVNYYRALLKWDPLTAFLIFLGLLFGKTCFSSSSPPFKATACLLATGIWLHMGYVVRVGGDFMAGRFLAFEALWGALLLIFAIAHRPRYYTRQAFFLFLLGLTYLVFFPDTALSSPIPYRKTPQEWAWHGIGIERAFYWNCTLRLYLSLPKDYPFPPKIWTRQGLAFRASAKKIAVQGNIGFFGYWAGTEKIIVDPHALSDPFLARLPAKFPSRIGHFKRPIPKGYLETLISGENRLADPDLRAYYARLSLVTQGPLWSWKRIRTLICLNLGCYRHYLQSYIARHPSWATNPSEEDTDKASSFPDDVFLPTPPP